MARALIIDDDETERSAIASAFDFAGFDVAVATNGKTGLDIVKQDGADVIVLDLVMPVLDGYGFLEALQADAELADIPVIVVSAADYDARLLRTVAYVKKPCRMYDIVDRAREWVARRANG